MKINHLNCVEIESPFGSAIGHCLLLSSKNKLILIDAGLSVAETQRPYDLLGKELVENTGFKFDLNNTALMQIKRLGFDHKNVENIVCSHFDPDHIGGLLDFPNAKVHTSKEEFDSFKSGHSRYINRQLAHEPKMVLYENNDSEFFGLPARKLNLDFETDIFLIPLFGHTTGHCGVAFKTIDKWIFYVGDAYYYRAELTNTNHPVDQLATMAAMDNNNRINSLNQLRGVIQDRGNKMEYFGYHDPLEFP